MPKTKAPSKRTKRASTTNGEGAGIMPLSPSNGDAVLSPSVEATAPKTLEAAAPATVDSSSTKAESAAPLHDTPVRKPDGKKSESRSNVVPINLEDEIRRRAYELAEQRGFQGGNETEDWLRAEHEVLQRYRQQSA